MEIKKLASPGDDVRRRLSSLFNGMMRSLFNEKGSEFRVELVADPAVQEFVGAHASALDSAFEKVDMSEAMRRRLTRSNYIFSGMKAFHELHEAFPSLLDENGDRKPFERFLNDVQSIDKTYNANYLRAEYNFVAASAEMAGRWEQFMADGDRYYLQYRTQRDNKVRPEHAALDGVTLPLSDSFWEEFYPPNGWNCRCTVVQVRKSKCPATDHDEAMRLGDEALQRDTKGMFRFNAGKEGKSVPDYNPYTVSRCRDCDIAKGGKGKSLARSFVPDNEVCKACVFIRQCEQLRGETIRHGKGTIEISHLVDRNDNDYSRLMQVAQHFAKDGSHVVLTPKMTRPAKFEYDCVYGSLRGTPYDGKCPDLKIDGLWYEHEGFVTDNPKRAFNNMMNHGLKQSGRLIIDRPELTDRFMLRSIQNRINLGINVEEVWLRENNGMIRLLYKKTDG
ncbi:phage head morphogenesis protein [Paramuribaculum intestinale]|jgi:SPP1 gp7 family putative phage head morphogenesis protein|uniref:phage head morphogenesis protein n=1 Tax=Paramuribaculum intestinale TaxID=2094151 RepID=UPI0025AF2060|nr:phage minor head protein [Paramuribaculum intestinale]